MYSRGGGLFDGITGIFKGAAGLVSGVVRTATNTVKGAANLAGSVVKNLGITGISTPLGSMTLSPELSTAETIVANSGYPSPVTIEAHPKIPTQYLIFGIVVVALVLFLALKK